MTGKPAKKTIHPDIPLDRAWQVGRRVYIRCGYNSTLNSQLIELGASWDREERARWAGSTKKGRIIELVLAAEERGQAIEAVKAEGRWVYTGGDEEIYQAVKRLGGVYDAENKRWAMRSDEDLEQVRHLLAARQERIERERAARKVAEREAREQLARDDAQDAADRAAATARRALADSGRTPTGETVTLTEVSTRVMDKAAASRHARPLGGVVKLRDGRRGVITGVKVWFTGHEPASVCWHAETHDQPHWDFRYQVAVVEPTAAEVAEDGRRAAERRDAAEIHDLVQNIRLHGQRLTEEERQALPGLATLGEIAESYGTGSYSQGTTLRLTVDGRAVWTHPGWPDDWTPTGGVVTDPDVVARLRAVLDGGRRVREVSDQMIYRYQVSVPE